MGQQQLLLVILVVIIVGLTTIIAMNIMGRGADNANRDAVRQDLASAAAYAQELWARPSIMDGADKNFTTLESAVILEKLRIMGTINEEEETVTNENGTYSITSSESQLTITGVPSSGGEDIQTIVCYDNTNSAWRMNTGSPEADTPEGCSDD